MRQTYFTPAFWAFYAWPIIHLFLFGTVIYQFTSSRAKTIVIDGVSWWFPIMAIIYATFIKEWADHQHTVTFVLSLFLSFISGNIYWTLKTNYLPKTNGDELFVHVPFSMWHAWNTFLVLLTAFEAFGVNAAKHSDGDWTVVFVILASFALLGTAGSFALSHTAAHRPAAFVISWILWAISDYQRSSPVVHWSAVGFSILSLVWVFVAMDGIYRRCTGHRTFLADEERRPLLGR